MNEVHKTTKKHQLKKAQSRQKNHEDDAESLKHSQLLEASRLSDRQKHGSHEDLGRSQKSAAVALEQSQKDDAEALKAVHEKHEARLKSFQDTERKSLDQKNQMISWLTGGYSATNSDEEDNTKKDGA